VILADSANDLQTLPDRVNEESQRLDLKVNNRKTKCMVIRRNDTPNIIISMNGESIEQVTQFKFLGRMINQ